MFGNLFKWKRTGVLNSNDDNNNNIPDTNFPEDYRGVLIYDLRFWSRDWKAVVGYASELEGFVTAIQDYSIDILMIMFDNEYNAVSARNLMRYEGIEVDRDRLCTMEDYEKIVEEEIKKYEEEY